MLSIYLKYLPTTYSRLNVCLKNLTSLAKEKNHLWQLNVTFVSIFLSVYVQFYTPKVIAKCIDLGYTTTSSL